MIEAIITNNALLRNPFLFNGLTIARFKKPVMTLVLKE
jgi:hypothetical protein